MTDYTIQNAVAAVAGKVLAEYRTKSKGQGGHQGSGYQRTP